MKIQTPLAWPLSWPLGWPRAKWREESRFRRASSETNRIAGRRHTIDESTSKVFDELDRLGAKEVTLSTNLVLRMDGRPKGGQSMPGDPGVAVYFKLNSKPIVLPCDKWNRVECNLWAVGCHIEAMRGQRRWGVGSIERDFAGYMQLEAQTKPKWFEVLQCGERDSREQINEARKMLLKKYHPDGTEPDPLLFNEVGEAFRIAMELTNQ